MNCPARTGTPVWLVFHRVFQKARFRSGSLLAVVIASDTVAAEIVEPRRLSPLPIASALPALVAHESLLGDEA